jgi:transposase-like protein
MEPKTRNSSTTSSNPSPKPKRNRPPAPAYSAQEKAQAILRVWTERCKPSQVCREMNLPWITFSEWQQRAMEGMLQALEPRVNLSKGEALSPRLQALLQRQQSLNTRKLAQRLEQIQLAKPPEETAKTP